MRYRRFLQEAPLDVAWSFGGDFSRIGSFPLSKDSVFGSFSKRPDNLSSYRPAFIGPQGEDAIAPLSKDPYYEPRDGSGTVDGVTWYSSTLSDAYDTTINNWQLGVWDRKSDSSRVLASAQELNDTAETPALPGEVVPTMNGGKVVPRPMFAGVMNGFPRSWSATLTDRVIAV